MAHEIQNQRRCIVVPSPRFIDFRSVAVNPQPPPIGFVPVVNPNFRSQVVLLPPPPPPHHHPGRFALDPSALLRMDEERTNSLIQFMTDEGLVPNQEEEEKRKDAIQQLKQIVLAWIQKVAWQRGFPASQVANISATVLTYGSYGLGAHGPESDIDALCAGPFFATMAEDFFVVLRNMLQSRPEVSDIHCVKDAKVPLMRFKFNGISIDLPYARLRVLTVPDDIDIFHPFLLRDIDETSRKSLSGVRANVRILQLVPNVEKFQSVLRCLKLWAKRRGIYCNLLGYFGGIHIMVLTAYVCQRNPNASINSLISIFFETFDSWPWPRPVMLEEGLFSVAEIIEARALMPIQLPCSPNELCQSNITQSTFWRITQEFRRGHNITRQDILRPDFEWRPLFDPFAYAKRYRNFVRIFLSASNQEELGDWVGWVKSRFRSLLLKLEEAQGYCDPNPTEYIDSNVTEPHVVFYWGLNGNFTDIDPVEEYLMKHISNSYQGPFGNLALSMVESSQLPKEAQIDSSSATSTTAPKVCWRIFNHNQPRKQVYSQYYLPTYFVGYEEGRNDDPNQFPSIMG